MMMDSFAALLGAREKELSAIYESLPGILFYIAVEPDGEFRFVSVSRDFLSDYRIEARAGCRLPGSRHRSPAISRDGIEPLSGGDSIPPDSTMGRKVSVPGGPAVW